MNSNDGPGNDDGIGGPAERRPTRIRAVVLITLAVVALAASTWHVLMPSAAGRVATSKAAIATSVPTRTPIVKRPYGILHLDGLDIPSPQMHVVEIAFIHTLISQGFVVQRVDPSPWDTRLKLADADIVTTNRGVVNVIAAYDNDHPVSVCTRSVAIIAGADVPTYELSAGDTSITVQIAGPVFIGHVGNVLVFTQDQGMWQRLNPVAALVTCPDPAR